MADNIRLITWSGQNVKPVNDANIYEAALGSGGVKYGCIVSASGANRLSISAGNGVICGRAFEITDSTIQVQLSGSGTLQGRVYVHLDLSNTQEPISIMTQTGNSVTPPIQQENINVTNGIYEINLATFSVSPSAISNVVNVAPVLDLQAQIQAVADEATRKINALANVARTGSYYDLTNKPTMVNGVKGNSETSYRSGNVNLTAANIGAIPAVSGGANQLLGFTGSNTVGAITLDVTPTYNSNKPVTSGGVYAAIQDARRMWIYAGALSTGAPSLTLPKQTFDEVLLSWYGVGEVVSWQQNGQNFRFSYTEASGTNVKIYYLTGTVGATGVVSLTSAKEMTQGSAAKDYDVINLRVYYR